MGEISQVIDLTTLLCFQEDKLIIRNIVENHIKCEKNIK